eukprot:CAMPEP_0172799524 /NCGR_PEP_ID=MMETSP1075-20121228/1926_1 /TAXON_ID=2916 /ORGANISM="Ceratium fusus, Strain PA161109" /LENGTH=62 /DNA_ID=CAMNT_0013637225 /DNA_START=100 /DNA_END=288 /DNA_ORIENTATION=-
MSSNSEKTTTPEIHADIIKEPSKTAPMNKASYSRIALVRKYKLEKANSNAPANKPYGNQWVQ